MSIEKIAEQWECSCDIEIAFPGIELDALMKAASALPIEGCYIDDKSDRGWGCVIARDQCWLGDRRKVSTLIVEFLSPLQPLIQAVTNNFNPPAIVRLGVYYGTFTLTLQLDKQAIKCLDSIFAELEISTYPSGD